MKSQHTPSRSAPDYQRLRQVLDTVPFEQVIGWVFDAPEPRSNALRSLWHSLLARWKQLCKQ